MNRINVESTLSIYEINGGPVPPCSDAEAKVIVRSHPIHSDRVCICLGTGAEVTVLARDLITAIENARNAG